MHIAPVRSVITTGLASRCGHGWRKPPVSVGLQLRDYPTVHERFKLPLFIREKLSIYGRGPTVSIFRNGKALSGEAGTERRRAVFEQFKLACERSERRGIAGHVDAIVNTTTALDPGESAFLRFQKGSHSRDKGVSLLFAPGDLAERARLEFFPYPITNLQCRISDVRDGSVTIAKCKLRIVALADAERLRSTALLQPEGNPEDEVEHVTNAFSLVVERFCAEMTFQSFEEAASTLAEALLHVLQFRSQLLKIDELNLKVEFAESSHSPAITLDALAKWKSGEQNLSGDESEAREVEVIVKDAAKEVDEDEQDGDVERNEDIAGDQDCATVGAPASSVEPGNFTANRSISSLLVKRTPQKLQLENWSDCKSQIVVQKVGIPLSTVTLTWKSEHANSLSQFTRSDLKKAVERAVANASGYGFFAAAEAANNVMQSVPGRPLAILMFRALEESEGEPNKCVDLVAKSRDNGGHVSPLAISATLSFAGRSWTHFNINDGLPQKPHCLDTNFRFSISSLTALTRDEKDTVASVARIRDAVEAQIAPIIQEQANGTLNDLASRCAAAIKQMQQPICGLLHFSLARITLRAMSNGAEVAKAMGSTAATQIVLPGQESAVPDNGFAERKNGIFIALGSNLGDRFAAIESACRLIDEDPDMQIIATSGLFETEPMYVEDQDRFLNGVCQINTKLEPIKLLDRLQAIENTLGRVKIIDKGPRNIDLDIVAYGQTIMDTDRLIIPHRLMLEREFVLRPMADIAKRFRHPRTKEHVGWHLAQLPPSPTPMWPLTPSGPGGETLRSLDPQRRTVIMSILNVTPDSFSDGGINQPTDMEALKATVASHIAQGATIIDIGGQSSRPNAEDITAEEELARILPAIEAIKSLPEASNIAISIDTYRATVAEAAIKAGAHIINDISAGLLDPEMLPTIARLGCTYIMMHMRGTPHTMQNEENTSYPEGLIPTIAAELKARLDAAQEAGIRRWRIILDPGVGFAKTVDQNLEILREFGTLRNHRDLRTLPWLVGSSRKSFIGKITEVEKASERIAGTAATVTAAVQGGAEIVRVHDVEEMKRVVKMADAMYRVPVKREVEEAK